MEQPFIPVHTSIQYIKLSPEISDKTIRLQHFIDVIIHPMIPTVSL